MKSLSVKKLNAGASPLSLPEISALLSKMGSAADISTINWTDFPLKPDVRVSIGYSDYEIFLKFTVHEYSVKAEMTASDQNVYEDSCVEFFVSPEEDGIYYNFEFNPIGTLLMASGTGREGRVPAPREIIDSVRRLPSMGNKPFSEISADIGWDLTVAIPLTAFYRHSTGDLKNRSFKANFYKCGDKLSTPHYLSWNAIGTEKPDFHCPPFFGTLRFE